VGAVHPVEAAAAAAGAKILVLVVRDGGGSVWMSAPPASSAKAYDIALAPKADPGGSNRWVKFDDVQLSI
jgi:hypothetical protein